MKSLKGSYSWQSQIQKQGNLCSLDKRESSLLYIALPQDVRFTNDKSQPSVEGRHPTRVWTVRGEAIAFAEAEQAYLNADGDPDGDYCRVYRSWSSGGGRDCTHITTPIQTLKAWEPQPTFKTRLRLAWRPGFLPCHDIKLFRLSQNYHAFARCLIPLKIGRAG